MSAIKSWTEQEEDVGDVGGEGGSFCLFVSVYNACIFSPYISQMYLSFGEGIIFTKNIQKHVNLKQIFFKIQKREIKRSMNSKI